MLQRSPARQLTWFTRKAKISRSLPLKADKTAENESRAKEYEKEKASQVHGKADEKIKLATEKTTDKASNAKIKKGDTNEDAKQKFHMASDKASIGARNARDGTADSMEKLGDEFSNAYDEFKKKLNIPSKETIENPKDKAEDANEGTKHQFKMASMVKRNLRERWKTGKIRQLMHMMKKRSETRWPHLSLQISRVMLQMKQQSPMTKLNIKWERHTWMQRKERLKEQRLDMSLPRRKSRRPPVILELR